MKWAREDSNLRRHCQQIYSLPPLATWVHAPIRNNPPRPYIYDLSGRMGAGGFEPPNTNVRGFTIPVLWPLGYTPLCCRADSMPAQSHLSDSNRGPADYKSAALSTELRWQIVVASIVPTEPIASLDEQSPAEARLGFNGLYRTRTCDPQCVILVR